jgi:hypothetical protein
MQISFILKIVTGWSQSEKWQKTIFPERYQDLSAEDIVNIHKKRWGIKVLFALSNSD